MIVLVSEAPCVVSGDERETKRQGNNARKSGGEHFVQKGEDFLRCGGVDFAQPFYQSVFVHGANLVQDDLSISSAKPHRNTGGIGMALSGHRRDDDSADMTVHFVGRDDQTRTGFADFAAFGGIESDEVYLEAGCYHRHSFLSHFVAGSESRSRSASSLCSDMRRNASSQPLLGLVAERTTRWSLCASSSTVSSRRHSSKSFLGMRMPRELPMRTTLVFMILSSELPVATK